MKKIYKYAPIIFLTIFIAISIFIMCMSYIFLSMEDSNAINQLIFILAPFVGIIGTVYFGIWGENKLENQKGEEI